MFVFFLLLYVFVVVFVLSEVKPREFNVHTTQRRLTAFFVMLNSLTMGDSIPTVILKGSASLDDFISSCLC